MFDAKRRTIVVCLAVMFSGLLPFTSLSGFSPPQQGIESPQLIVNVKGNNRGAGSRLGFLELGHDADGWYLVIQSANIDPKNGKPVATCMLQSVDRSAIIDIHRTITTIPFQSTVTIICEDAQPFRPGMFGGAFGGSINLDVKGQGSSTFKVLIERK